MDEMKFIVDGALRDEMVSHYEVLEKVKDLLLIPEFESMTLKQVAEYYEVAPHAIEMICSRNSDELESDGVCRKRVNDFLNSQHVRVEKSNYITTFTYNNGMILSMSNSGLKIFPRRAILRVGMLLQQSKVAQRVRTALLDIEEKTDNEIKTQDINEEQKLALELGMAQVSGNMEAIAIATGKMMSFKNRHIAKLENDNRGLAGEILEWSDRNKLNAGVRKLTAITGIPFGNLWNELYKNFQYKYGIQLKSRGDKPFIQWIKEYEWESVIKIFCAMCEAYEQSPTDMFQQTTPKDALERR